MKGNINLKWALPTRNGIEAGVRHGSGIGREYRKCQASVSTVMTTTQEILFS